MSDKENSIEAKYPMRDADAKSQWDKEFRKEWNRKYRQEIKEGKRQPVKRSEQPSKWQDKNFRKSYDDARLKKIAAEKTEKKLSFDEVGDKRPNYTKKEKGEILKKLLELVQQGKQPAHPYFELALAVKPEFKRKYPSNKKD